MSEFITQLFLDRIENKETIMTTDTDRLIQAALALAERLKDIPSLLEDSQSLVDAAEPLRYQPARVGKLASYVGGIIGYQIEADIPVVQRTDLVNQALTGIVMVEDDFIRLGYTDTLATTIIDACHAKMKGAIEDE